MTRHESHGSSVQVGDFMVGYAVELAEGMYHLQGDKLVWENPTDENAHIEVVVRDGADGRFIPALSVQVTVTDADGKEVGRHDHPFLWHPWLYHYGRNWKLPGDGKYTIQVDVDVPDFPRHDKRNGQRYTRPVRAIFEDVRVRTGKKIS
jgi:hypothetical protein